MKASEAPEKIHIQPNAHDRWFEGNTPNGLFVEYTRTDAFIKKVESFLNKKNDRDSYTIGYIRRHLKDIIREVGL